MLILNPDSYLLPTYRISPFITNSISRNLGISDKYSNTAKDYFNNRFGVSNWILTLSGREALALTLKTLEVNPSNRISIFTPSGNSYISSCVTKVIEQFCRWDRKSTGDILFVNHEFGYLQENILEISKMGLPLIEDCCTSFFSQDALNNIGKYGNYSFYSFPKFFSIQIGGLLVGNNILNNKKITENTKINSNEIDYILRVIGFELSHESAILEKRNFIFNYSILNFAELGFTLRFQDKFGVVPSVLLLNNNGIVKDLVLFKEYLNQHGIQNSNFYGEDAFFIPCHQNLEKTDIDYFRFVTENFINQ